MSEGFEAVIAELRAAMVERPDPEVVQIRISEVMPEGSMVVLPLAGEEAERYQVNGIQRPQELLIAPADWKKVLQSVPRLDLPTEAIQGKITALAGIRVVNG